MNRSSFGTEVVERVGRWKVGKSVGICVRYVRRHVCWYARTFTGRLFIVHEHHGIAHGGCDTALMATVYGKRVNVFLKRARCSLREHFDRQSLWISLAFHTS